MVCGSQTTLYLSLARPATIAEYQSFRETHSRTNPQEEDVDAHVYG
jgi:hypothetical protein